MARKSTIRLLLINQSDNEGERLVSLFRNAGRVARVHRAKSAEDLHSMLKPDSWDLLIADDNHPEIAVEQCLQQLAKTQLDLPSIVLRDNNAGPALDAGACDVIEKGNDQRLVFAAFRELSNLELRRELAGNREKLAELEKNCELLMAQSQDAIAYVADGMLISCNAAFSQRFGYIDADELDCAPIIDLIANTDQEEFKNLLKTQLKNTNDSSDFNFNGVKPCGETFVANMQLCSATLEDEDCIQLSIKDKGHNLSESNTSSDLDPATGLYSHDYFLNRLSSNNKQAADGNLATLLFISIDKFTDIRNRYGISNTYAITIDVAAFIQKHCEEDNHLSHFCDDGFTMLLKNTSRDSALDFAKQLCQKLEQHIIELDGESIQCSISIGLLEISGQQLDANQLIDLAFNTAEQIRQSNEGEGNEAEFHIAVREKKVLGNACNDNELDTFVEDAIDDEQFALTFQPVVSLRGSSTDIYEVKPTMQTSDGQILEANQFLENLSFSTVNTRLDRWIIIDATKKLAAIDNNRSRLFINLTANALQDESLLPWLGVALKAGDIKPESLVFQFTEEELSTYLKPAKKFAKAIAALGCQLSIAEFGKSNDPLKLLQQVKANYVKISAEFTQELNKGSGNQILKAMVSSINDGKAKAIISGVENAAAMAQLWQLGVDFIQGSYLASPSAVMDYEFTDIA